MQGRGRGRRTGHPRRRRAPTGRTDEGVLRADITVHQHVPDLGGYGRELLAVSKAGVPTRRGQPLGVEPEHVKVVVRGEPVCHRLVVRTLRVEAIDKVAHRSRTGGPHILGKQQPLPHGGCSGARKSIAKSRAPGHGERRGTACVTTPCALTMPFPLHRFAAR